MKDIVELELIRESLVAVVNEMRANIIHSSYAPIIYEGHDFSCALMSWDGRQVAQGLADHPIHIFAVPYSTQQVITKFNMDINEGDLFLHNDPYTGGTHLNDILLLQPVFFSGKLGMFAAVRCHWNDVGGMTPGSLSGRVNEIIQEGIRIEPTKLRDRGVMNKPIVDLLLNNMRAQSERLGDFNAMIGTSRKAEEHLQRLYKRFGNGLLQGIENLITRSELQLREKIQMCPNGNYYADGYIESDGTNSEPLVIKLKLTIRGDEIIADFTGTSSQTNGPTNCGPAMPLNSVGTIVKSFLDPKTPINHGSFQPITVISKKGTFINADNDAPCGGMAECKFLIDSVVAAAMGKVVPEMTVGDLKGGANHIIISGLDAQGRNYIHYEWPAGGTGASLNTDGSNAVRSFNEGDFNSIQSVEMIEDEFPIQIERCEIRNGSCGDGQFRGGFGLRRDVRILGPSGTLSVLSEKNIIPPYGVEGGGSGAVNCFTVIRDGGVVQPSDVPGKVSGFPLIPGDTVREETAGGGGYGDPLMRDPEKVLQDVVKGYLSKSQAKLRYGVQISKGKINHTTTQDLRKEQRERRMFVKLKHTKEEIMIGSRREVIISALVANRLGVENGQLVELLTGRGAPMRAWARVDTKIKHAIVSPTSLKILGASQGDEVEIRSVVKVH